MYALRNFFIAFLLVFFSSFSAELWSDVSSLNEKIVLKKLKIPIENIKNVNGIEVSLTGYSVEIEKSKVEYRKNGFTWFGKVKNDDFSTVIFTVQNGYLFGVLNFLDKHYRIEPYNGDIYALSEEYNFGASPDTPRIKETVGKEKLDLSFIKNLQEKNKYIDLLLLYTKQVRDLWGDALGAYVQNLVDIVNAVLENSKTEARINLVGTLFYDTPDVNENVNTVIARFYMIDAEDIKDLRDRYKADVLILLRKKDLNSSSVKCGVTNGIFKLDKFFSDWKNRIDEVIDYYRKTPVGIIEVNKIFNGIQKDGNYCSELFFPHHIAHSLGCDHNRENISCGSGQAFHYSFGYKGEQNFFTLTSPNNPKILYLSDPYTLLNGEHIGIGDNEEREPANNKKTVMYTSFIVSNFEIASRYPEAFVDTDSIVFSDVQPLSLPEKTISVYNYGERDLKISVESKSPYIKISNNCSVIKQYQKCDIKVSLDRAVIKNEDTQIVIRTNDPDKKTITVPVHIEPAIKEVPDIKITKESLDFGEVLIGKNKTLSIEIKNTGNADLIINSVYFQNNLFSIKNSCSLIKEGKSCILSVDFKPNEKKEYKDYLIVVSNDPDSPQISIPVSGYGKELKISDFTVSTENIDFGDVFIGNGKSFSIEVRNTGNTNQRFSIQEESYSGDFTVSSNCHSVISPGAKCSVKVSFFPSLEGEQHFSFDIKGANGKVITVNVKGKGVLPAQKRVSIEPVSLDFKADVGKSDTEYIKIRNTGNTLLNISSITLDGEGFDINSRCKRIDVRGECRVKVIFTPDKPGIYTGKITIQTDADNGKTVVVSLSGKGYGKVDYKDRHIKLSIENSSFISPPRSFEQHLDDNLVYLEPPVEYSVAETGLPIKETLHIDNVDNDTYIRIFYNDGTFKDIPATEDMVFKLEDGNEYDSDKSKNGQILRRYAVIKISSTQIPPDNPSDNLSGSSSNSSGSGGCSFNKEKSDFTLLYILTLVLFLALRNKRKTKEML